MKNHKQLPSLALRLVADRPISTILLAIICALALIASPNALAQTYTVIHTFTGGGDGANPEAGVTYKAGTLYGTAYSASTGFGTVYQTFPLGSSWHTLPISPLSASTPYPWARVVFSPDHHLYGTASAFPYGPGSVFDLIPPLSICRTANCFWKDNVIYTYTSYEEVASRGDLIWDNQGNIYSTTYFPLDEAASHVYELTNSGNSWTGTLLYSFANVGSISGVVFDGGGNLFGTTYNGGTDGFGVVFQLTKYGVQWLETNAYNFQNGTDGRYPIAGVTYDSVNNVFYGATSDGGTGGGGTVFELIPLGDTYTFQLIYSFSGQTGNNCGPWANLTWDASSNTLYGTTYCDGANNLGNVFKLTNTQNGWVYTDLYHFTGSNDGANPISNVTIDPTDGKTLYGTASMGGSQNVGVVWMIKQ